MGCNEPCCYANSCKNRFLSWKINRKHRSNSDGDVIPAGDAAEGYYAITTHLREKGGLQKVIDDIVATVYKAGKGDLADKAVSVLYIGT